LGSTASAKTALIPMQLEVTPIEGVHVIHKRIFQDGRGQFSRLYAADEFANIGLNTRSVHVNSSTSTSKGTLRGIHFQYPPFSETKIVSCLAGAVWDVAVDLRPDSPTRFQWFGVELTPSNGKSLHVPDGCGHAFLTLADSSTVVYVDSNTYNIDYESGAKFDDPYLDIKWPPTPTVISDKDRSWKPLADRANELLKLSQLNPS